MAEGANCYIIVDLAFSLFDQFRAVLLFGFNFTLLIVYHLLIPCFFDLYISINGDITIRSLRHPSSGLSSKARSQAQPKPSCPTLPLPFPTSQSVIHNIPLYRSKQIPSQSGKQEKQRKKKIPTSNKQRKRLLPMML